MMRKTGAVTICMLIALAAGCRTQEISAPAEVDPKADAVLRKMCALLGDATAFSFEAKGVMEDPLESGQLVEISRRNRIWVKRPASLYVETESSDFTGKTWFDGEVVSHYRSGEAAYASIPISGSIEEMLDAVIERYGLTLPAADLLFRDLYATLIENVQSGTHLGTSEIEGVACHHLAFRQEVIDWQLWVDAGAKPVPRKLVIVYKDEPGDPEYEAVFSNWNLSAKLDDDLFRFQAPAGAKRVKMSVLLGVAEGEEQ